MTRRILREVVLRTNGCSAIERGYRAIYRAAVTCFLRYVVRNRPMVRSVYIRRSQNAQDWIPGLSDIDLTVILDSPSSQETEYDALDEFWAAYARLKSFFPMFGEVEILSQHEFGFWLASTGYSPGRRAWKLVYGEPDASLDIEATPDWRLRALRLAWWIYEDLLPPCVAQPESLVRNRDIQRRVDKIFRLLAPLLCEAGHADSTGFTRDPADMIAAALNALEKAAVHVLPIGTTRRGVGVRPRLFQSRVDEGRMLIVEDGLDRESLARLISKNSQENQNAPLLLPRCLLEYRVRFYNPYDYAMLSRDWTATAGRHPLEEMPPPREPELLQYLLDRLRNLQVASRGEELFTGSLTVEQINSTLVMVAALRLLRDGRPLRCRNEIWRQSAVEFPEYGPAVEKIGSLIGRGLMPEARREYFFLLRSITDEFAALLDAADAIAAAASAP